MKSAPVHFFLGANTPNGFYSLYDQLMTKDSGNAVVILKGGAGCGKSTLMRRVANQLEGPAEYIQCSGDPDSLDAVYFPHLKTVIVDGTAPHVIEPRYPGVLDSYLNLGECYQTELLADAREEICRLTDQCSAQYRRAYRILSAAAQMLEPLPASALDSSAVARMQKRIRLIAAKELKRNPMAEGRGHLTKRFLGGITYQGLLCRFDTVDSLCDQVYELVDPYGLAHDALSFWQDTALAAGYDIISCPAPMQPERLQHLLIPELSLAFVTSTDALPYPGTSVRKLRFDHLPDSQWLRRNRSRLRFHKKMYRTLLEDAIGAFAEAKKVHDDLEALYNPSVSFDKVYQAADALADTLKKTKF